ncbi:hypothetical protein BXZ70DRAFT_914431 [Cristinia sonorae]|uniref:Cytochrome b561 domain-containing protein n=1 Tax=Cristinia sonorae TaxID=1940300 RepID=A0A8K0XVD0_9AGAR|nr:hypothetical protein BXZ70DRAFT_914431 [Cristinia sonorae]
MANAERCSHACSHSHSVFAKHPTLIGARSSALTHVDDHHFLLKSVLPTMASLPIPLVPPTISTEAPPATEEERQPLVEQEGVPDTLTDPASVQGMGMKDFYDRPEGREGDTIALTAAAVSAGVFFVTTWVMALASPSSYGLFTWHPLMQSLAISLFTYGILTLQPTAQPKTKAAGLVRHQLAMIALGLPIVLFGTSAIYYNKIRNDREHFTTWHGTFGGIVVALSVFQVLLGGGSVWFNGRAFGGNPKAKQVWKYHRASGYIIYPLYLFTAYLGGAYSHWSGEHSVLVVRFLAFTIAPAVLLLAVFSRVRLSKMKFF